MPVCHIALQGLHVESYRSRKELERMSVAKLTGLLKVGGGGKGERRQRGWQTGQDFGRALWLRIAVVGLSLVGVAPCRTQPLKCYA